MWTEEATYPSQNGCLVLFCPAIAPLRPSVQKHTARQVSGVSRCVGTVHFRMGIWGTYAPALEIDYTAANSKERAQIRCHSPRRCRTPDLRPPTSRTAVQAQIPPREYISSSGAGRYNRPHSLCYTCIPTTVKREVGGESLTRICHLPIAHVERTHDAPNMDATHRRPIHNPSQSPYPRSPPQNQVVAYVI